MSLKMTDEGLQGWVFRGLDSQGGIGMGKRGKQTEVVCLQRWWESEEPVWVRKSYEGRW